MQETQVLSLGREDPLEKEWQHTLVFLPGESHGQRSLVGYSPWGGKESDTTECAHAHTHTHMHALSLGLLFLLASTYTAYGILVPRLGD